MTEVEVLKLYGLSHTRISMHERFTLLAEKPVGWRGKRNPYSARTRSQTMNPELIVALAHQLENQAQRFQPVRGFSPRGRGRGRGGLQRAGSEGSLRGLPWLRRSNSFGNISQSSKDQSWRRSNGNLSSRGSVNGSVHSWGGSQRSSGSRRGGQRGGGQRGRGMRGINGVRDMNGMRGMRGVRGRGRSRGIRGRIHQGRVARVNERGGARGRPARGVGRPARGVGRRGLRRNAAGAAAAAAVAVGARGRGFQRGRGRGRGGIPRNPTPVPTKEELDAQLDQYMCGTKAALDKELDEYMRNAMDFD